MNWHISILSESADHISKEMLYPHICLYLAYIKYAKKVMRLMCTLVSHPSKKINKEQWLESARLVLRNAETIRALPRATEIKGKGAQECCAMKLVLDTRLAYIKRILFFMKQQPRYTDWLSSLGLSSVEGHASNDELETCVLKLYRFQTTMYFNLTAPCNANGPNAKIHVLVLEELSGCVKEFDEMKLSLEVLQDDDDDTDLDVEYHQERQCGRVRYKSPRQHVPCADVVFFWCGCRRDVAQLGHVPQSEKRQK